MPSKPEDLVWFTGEELTPEEWVKWQRWQIALEASGVIRTRSLSAPKGGEDWVKPTKLSPKPDNG